LAARLAEQGHTIPKIDFDIGRGPLDRFIDLPPFAFQVSESARALWVYEDHIKVAIDGIATTCYGMNIKKAG
jgi:hypothetical protein